MCVPTILKQVFTKNLFRDFLPENVCWRIVGFKNHSKTDTVHLFAKYENEKIAEQFGYNFVQTIGRFWNSILKQKEKNCWKIWKQNFFSHYRPLKFMVYFVVDLYAKNSSND